MKHRKNSIAATPQQFGFDHNHIGSKPLKDIQALQPMICRGDFESPAGEVKDIGTTR